jgi:hypothetical protein
VGIVGICGLGPFNFINNKRIKSPLLNARELNT